MSNFRSLGLGLLCVVWLAALKQRASGQGDSVPAVPGFVVTHYATVTDPSYCTFPPDDASLLGRDATGSGGSGDDAVPIHRVGPSGISVTEYGPATEDLDGVLFDTKGACSSEPGSVLPAGEVTASAGTIRAIRPDLTLITIAPLSASFGNPGFMRLDGTGRFAFPSARAQG